MYNFSMEIEVLLSCLGSSLIYIYIYEREREREGERERERGKMLTGRLDGVTPKSVGFFFVQFQYGRSC